MDTPVDIEKLGKHINALRKRRNLTLEALAQLSGISKGYLSRIENAQHGPSFAVITKLARVFSVSLSYLLEEDNDTSPYMITRVADRKKYTFKDDTREHTQWSLTSSASYKRMEPQIFEVPFETLGTHEFNDERFMYILEGTLQLLDGQIVTQGDSIYLMPNTPHGAISLGEQKAKVLLVICS